MSIEAVYVLAAIAIGIGATLIMDLWNLFLKRTFSIPSLDYCLLGRWLGHMPRGIFRHASISTSPQRRFECKIGWTAHYTIGVVFALVFVLLTADDWLARPTLLPALLYGIGTVVFPFFIMQPSFGLGIAASRTPKPMQARLKSLATHTVFGVGLWICALGVSYMLRPVALGDAGHEYLIIPKRSCDDATVVSHLDSRGTTSRRDGCGRASRAQGHRLQG